MDIITLFRPAPMDPVESPPDVAKSLTFSRNCERTPKTFGWESLNRMKTFFQKSLKRINTFTQKCKQTLERMQKNSSFLFS